MLKVVDRRVSFGRVNAVRATKSSSAAGAAERDVRISRFADGRRRCSTTEWLGVENEQCH